MTPTVEWLADLEALRALPQRYARGVDARDRVALGELFDPAGTVEGARGAHAAPDYLDNLCRGPRAFAVSMHVFADPLIDLAPGGTEAAMDTYATVHQLRAAGEVGHDLLLGMRYRDSVVKHDGAWRIRHRRAETLWMRALPR